MRYTRTELLLFTKEFAGRGIDIGGESRIGAGASVHDMPDELVRAGVPIQPIEHGSIWLLLQDFLSAVLLGDFEGLVGIDLQELHVEGVGRSEGSILRPRTNAAGRGIRTLDSRPRIWLGSVESGRSKGCVPDYRFAVVALVITHNARLQ